MPIRSDAARIAWLERMAREPGGLLLHAESQSTGRLGLGIGTPKRSLRDAIDQAIYPFEPRATDPTPAEHE